MIIKQFYLGCLSHASYIIADEQQKLALIVDPQRDIDSYSEYLAEHHLNLMGVALTHFHADFIAGHIELQERYGIPVFMGERADADFSFQALADGQALMVGDVKVSSLNTPGHTPEGISLVVHDENDEPYAVLTGDTLFIGDVGRPDLLASIGVTAEELAAMLFDSLHNKLLTLPDDVLVYPAHGAGSLCGKNLSSETVSTIGAQRKENYALRELDKTAFKELVTKDQPASPAYFLHDAILNKRDRETLEEAMNRSHNEITIDGLRLRAQKGEQIIDIRSDDEVHEAFYKRAVNVGLNGKYATWAGSLLNNDVPITLITHDDDHKEAIMRLGRIGFDNVSGYVKWSMLKDHLLDDEILTTKRIHGEDLSSFLDDEQPIILDVRSHQEYLMGHLPGSLNIPLHELKQMLSSFDKESVYLVHCAGGYRSSAGVTLMHSMGFEHVYDLAGGLKPAYLEQLADQKHTV